MTPITKGMSPLQFITALNNNFNGLKYSATVLITLVESSNVSTIKDNFDVIESETTSPPIMDFIIAGISGEAFISRLNENINRYLGSTMTFTVGVGKNYTTINDAITRAISENTIIINENTYNECLILSTKRLDFIGVGDVKIIYTWDGNPTSILADISTDSTFTNIYFEKIEDPYHSGTPVINISGCSPVFYQCTIYHIYDHPLSGYSSPMTISNASVVTMIGCSIDYEMAVNNDVLVTDTSILNFEGTIFKARLLAQDNSVVTIDVDELYVGSATLNCIRGEDDSRIIVKINTRSINWSVATSSELPAGKYDAPAFMLYDNCHFTLSGHEIAAGNTYIYGAGVICTFKDIVTTYGQFWFTTAAPATNTTLIIFDNCQITLDADNDTIGYHIFEEIMGAEVRVINGCVIVFSGHHGNWHTMGNPGTVQGKFYMRDSEIIDNCDDNIPFGLNYQATFMAYGEIDIEDSIFTNRYSDGAGANFNLMIVKVAGIPMKVRLKNVTFNNSEVGLPCIYQSQNVAYDASDYICAENVTNNGIGLLFNDVVGGGMTTYTLLTSQCP